MRRETVKTDHNSPYFDAPRKGWLEVDVRRTCAKCKQRKPIAVGCRTKPKFVCAECSK